MALRIALGTDHGGFEEKNALAAFLAERDYAPIDCGTFSRDSTDYPIYAGRVARAVSTGAADLGVILCRSGNGMMMVANRYAGVRAALAMKVRTAQLAREHNCANVLVLAADHMVDEMGPVVLAWLEAIFEGGRHARRVDMIDALDRLAVSNLATAQLVRFGQSPWLDDISDHLISSGELERLVHEWHIRGMTSNPAIFNKSIGQGVGSYPKQLALLKARGVSVDDAYEEMVLHDIQRALDIMRPVYNRTGGDDGFVSLEVLPRFGHDEEGTVEEAVRLFQKIDRPNLMIKVPSTPAGIRAFERLTALGVNVNVTLMFSLRHYRDVAAAYVRGLRDRLAGGKPIHQVRSVASLFISRIDVAANKELAACMQQTADGEARDFLQNALDKVAIANTKQIYAEFRELFFGEPFQDLARAGGAVQRPLWASTGVKSSDVRDVLYVEELVAPYTVNTIPRATLDGLIDHGCVRSNAIADGLDDAEGLLRGLEVHKIDLDAICQKLQDDGLQAFADSFDALYATIGEALK